jgi:hypothetical protein
MFKEEGRSHADRRLCVPTLIDQLFGHLHLTSAYVKRWRFWIPIFQAQFNHTISAALKRE